MKSAPAASGQFRDDSRLGALGLGEETRLEMLADVLSDSAPAASQEPTVAQVGGAGAFATDPGARRRILRTYLPARTLVGISLLSAQLMGYWLAGHWQWDLIALCAGYVLESLLCWWWIGRPKHAGTRASLGRRLWWSAVGADMLAFGAMHWVDGSGNLNHAALLVLPVLMAGVLSPRLVALATAAAVTLMLLATALHRALAGGELFGLMSQAGLAGIGFFVIVLVSGEVSARLARQERSARESMALALQQAELNRLVIDEMSDGVLVVDRLGGVRAANPAARALLAEGGQCPPAPFSLRGQTGWRPLLAAIETAYVLGHWPTSGMDLTLAVDGEAPRSVRVRARFTRRERIGAEGRRDEMLGVLFMEELRSALARQRQERLVAMGRISAGIAHEIRNPLAAITQANALLMEDALRADQQRLARIVADNAERLKRIVDDVLEAAPGGRMPSSTLDLVAEVAGICSEWARTAGLVPSNDGRLQVDLPAAMVGAVFDADHLRRVLVNLLENALRHASHLPGAVRLSMELTAEACVRLAVASDGPPITEDVESHLFEPFHSTRSRGAGLGLYICRELCERHGASIEYLRRTGERHANVFQVEMRRKMIDASGRLHL